MPFRLQNYKSAEEARIALERELPKGTSRDNVMRFLKDAHLSCFDDEAEVLVCELIEPSSTMVHVDWQIAFHFDARKNLERISIIREFTGP
jgi:hypothetical protein